MQQSFSDMEYKNRKRITKREAFLDVMEQIIPWDRWIALIEPHYPKGHRGRPPKGIEKMLRMYLLQLWFHLSDEGVEDAVYDSYAMRKFMGLNFLDEQVPDATTLLKFRHLLEKEQIGQQMLDAINQLLEENGYLMRGGTIVDATLLAAPSSTKNETGERDPEMHQTKKGNQWHFGMKFHIGVDAQSGLVHSTHATAANVHDLDPVRQLIREDDDVVYGDAGYLGIAQREDIANDPKRAKINYRINERRGRIRKQKDSPGKQWDQFIERQKSSVRSKVEHPFLIIKQQFGYGKVVYRGLVKNANRLNALAASANLLMCFRSGNHPLLPRPETPVSG